MTYDNGRRLHETVLLAEIKERSETKEPHNVQKDIEGKRAGSVGCYHTC